MTVIEVKVYFDTICAWCYIGHRTLFQAIALFQKTYPGASSDDFKVSFSPFYRDRTLPDEAVLLESRLVSSLGEDKLQDVRTRVDRIGRANGIIINLQSLIGSTRSSQRLIHHAGTVGGSALQKDLLEQIYFRWFEIGGDITSHAFLLECAKAVRLNLSEATDVLETGKYGNEVDELDAQARRDGISCVPTFIIDGIKIEGAEDATTFYEAFVKIKEGEKANVSKDAGPTS
ncbi:hypothetical protein PRZ48_011946 [Zasmidium cellare]|uniref:DSBA-like thioredoxin domain-containing protein n=1 Tax=Zasmidium cellare TaxID=395010 RepID=A0ABR0E7S4_ZASCE|nr:hypothetical protein PRZ48_011946 [Zasmidium cellare]